MSCYICEICGGPKDADFDGCEAYKDSLICETCSAELENHDCHAGPEDGCDCQQKRSKLL